MNTKPPYQQVESQSWPSGDCNPIAILSLEPADFQIRYGIKFVEGADDLDTFRAATIRLSSGRHVLLMRYTGSPGAGTDVFGDVSEDAADLRRELLRAFQLEDSMLMWVSG